MLFFFRQNVSLSSLHIIQQLFNLKATSQAWQIITWDICWSTTSQKVIKILRFQVSFTKLSNELLGKGGLENALVFLYALVPGKCPKSFGLNVARLAGIQSTIIEKAKLKSESFFTEAESQE